MILNVGVLRGEVAITEPEHLNLLLGNMLKNGGCAVPRLGSTPFIAAENDPSHDETGDLGSNAQNGSAAADLDVVGMGTQAKQSKWLSPGRRNN